MKLTRFVFTNAIFISMLFLVLPVSNANALSLYDALAIAYNNNPQLKSERESLKAVDENLPQAFSQWFPTITGTIGRSSIEDTIPGFVKTISHPKSRSLSLNQPIFDGFRSMISVKQAHYRIRSGRERLRQVEQQIMSQAIIAYVDVVRTREVYNLSINNEMVLGEQLQATKDRFELGEATKTDVAQAESRFARGVSDTIDSEGRVVSAESGYKRIYEVDPPQEMDLPKNHPDLPETLDEIISISIKNNPTLRRAQNDWQIAKTNTTIAKTRLLPTAALIGSLNQDRGLRPRSGGGDLDTKSVEFRLTVPLFQSGSEYSRIRQSKRTEQSAEFQLQDIHNSIVDSATESWKNLDTSKANIKANTTSVNAAQIALDGIKEERDIGSRTTLDVLDAEQELFVAQVNLVTAKRNKIVSIYNLMASLGRLTASGLGLEVEIYDPNDNFQLNKFKVIGF